MQKKYLHMNSLWCRPTYILWGVQINEIQFQQIQQALTSNSWKVFLFSFHDTYTSRRLDHGKDTVRKLSQSTDWYGFENMFGSSMT